MKVNLKQEKIFSLPTIYKKAKAGATLYWRAEYCGDKRRSASGMVGGTEKMSEWTTCLPTNEGKANARTAAEQAKEESEASRDLKLKNSGYHVSAEDVGKKGKFVPMKAHTYNPKKQPRWPQWAQAKLNGYRMYADKTGLYTYGGTPIVTCPHIWEAIKHVFVKFPEAKIDGEAYNHTHRELLNRIGHIVRTTKNVTPELLEEARQVVQFHVFDGYQNESMAQANFSNRCQFYSKLDLFKGSVVYVTIRTVRDETEMKKFFEAMIALGYEGIILRDPVEGGYEQGRSHFVLKYKPREDDEFKVKSAAEGNGKSAGHLTSLTCETKQGVEFRSNVKWSFPAKKELWARRKELYGTQVTVSYAYLTEFGRPFHAYLEKVAIELEAEL